MKLKTLLALSIISLLSIGCYKDPDDSKHLNLRDDFTINDTLSLGSGKTANIVLLYGQSNATGCSRVDYLINTNKAAYDLYSQGFDNVFINLNMENFSAHTDGFVKNTLTTGYDVIFGPEMGISEKVSSAFSNETFIIKYTYGGTTLHDQWLDGQGGRGGLYNHSMMFTIQSLDYLLSKGYHLNFLGLCWMQGENDAVKGLKNYYDNTKALVSYYREDLKIYTESLRFVDAYINQIWDGNNYVNDAKRRFSQESELNYVIDTISLGLTTAHEPVEQPDIAHYDSQSMVLLGRAFGDALIQ